MFKILNKIRNRITNVVASIYADRLGIYIGKRSYFHGLPILETKPCGVIAIGENVSLISNSYYTALGVGRPVILRLLRDQAKITIGSRSGLSSTTICAANSVLIGEDCMIGADTIIADTDFHGLEPHQRRASHESGAVKSRPIVIEDNVFIGARSIILKGVTIGKNSVVGAGSVVTRSIPPNSVAAGNPCIVIRQLRQ